jgi:hypothetical protein
MRNEDCISNELFKSIVENEFRGTEGITIRLGTITDEGGRKNPLISMRQGARVVTTRGNGWATAHGPAPSIHLYPGRDDGEPIRIGHIEPTQREPDPKIYWKMVFRHGQWSRVIMNGVDSKHHRLTAESVELHLEESRIWQILFRKFLL